MASCLYNLFPLHLVHYTVAIQIRVDDNALAVMSLRAQLCRPCYAVTFIDARTSQTDAKALAITESQGQ